MFMTQSVSFAKISYVGWDEKWSEWINTTLDLEGITPIATYIAPCIFSTPPSPIEMFSGSLIDINSRKCCISHYKNYILCAIIHPLKPWAIIIDKYYKSSNKSDKRQLVLTSGYRLKFIKFIILDEENRKLLIFTTTLQLGMGVILDINIVTNKVNYYPLIATKILGMAAYEYQRSIHLIAFTRYKDRWKTPIKFETCCI